MTGTVLTLFTETILMTALLLGAVLLLRRPVAALFGPRLAYALWLIPALRLVLPPLPGGEQIVAAELAPDAMPIVVGGDVISTNSAVPESGLFEVLLAILPMLWLLGALLLLGHAVWHHLRWHRALLSDGIALDPVEGIAVVMSPRVEGPVATGLLRKTIAVPTDFFARYNQTERRLAIAHEVAHHRAGDLWANAAALVVLAVQWFNPLAWAAHRAFRFDQEAACDARILASLSDAPTGASAHNYACAIAKSVAGPRLLLAAPMTSGTKIKERLHMLTKDPKWAARPLLGRMLLGGGALTALAVTISTLPARIVYAAEPASPPPVTDAPPPPAAAEAEEKQIKRVMIIHGDESEVIDLSDAAATKDGDPTKKRIVHRVLVAGDGKQDSDVRVMMFEGAARSRAHAEEARAHAEAARADALAARADAMARGQAMRFSFPFGGLDRDELRATLKDQGIDDAKADAIIKQMEEKQAKRGAHSFAWSGTGHASSFAMAPVKCKDGDQARVMIDRSKEAATGSARVRMVQCGSEISRDKQIAAMKKARDRLAAQKGVGTSAEIRASVIADLDKSIAELEAKRD